METVENNASFKSLVKQLDIAAAQKIISSFVGHEAEYDELINSVESSVPSFFKDNNLIVLSADKEISEVVTHSISLSDLLNKLRKELDVVSSVLKTYGNRKLHEWNKEEGEELSSIRIKSTDGDRTVMITVKNQYSIDSEKIISMKKILGPLFDKTFKTESSWTVKNDKVKNVIDIIKNSLGKAGAAFVKESFVEKVTVKVQSRKLFDELLSSTAISDDIKEILRQSVKPQEPSITYPK